MFTSKMTKQLILVKISQFTIFATRMTFVTLVVWISNASVCSQVGTRVAATFGRENLEIIGTNLTVELLVDLSDVFLQLVELEKRIVTALRAAIFKQMVK